MVFRILRILSLLIILNDVKRVKCFELTSSLLTCEEYQPCWQHLNAELVDMIQGNLDNYTEPCNNFWQYACGNWAPDRSILQRDNFDVVVGRYAKIMSDFLSRKGNGYDDDDAGKRNHQNIDDNDDDDDDDIGGSFGALIKDLRNYFEACIKTQSYSLEMEKYLLELPKLVKKLTLPNWQEALRTNRWTENDAEVNWLDLIGELRRLGLNGVFFEQAIGMAGNDSTKYVIAMNVPSDKYDFEKKFELLNYLIEFNLIEGPTDAAWALATQVFAFEKQIKDLRTAFHSRKASSRVFSMDLGSLKEKVTNVDWQRYFNTLLAQEHVDSRLPLEVSNVRYFDEIAQLIENTEPKIVSFYVLLRFCKYLLDIKLQNNSKNCVEHMTLTMPLGMNFIYDRYSYDSHRKKDTIILEDIFNRLKMQFSTYLSQNKLNLTQTEVDYLEAKLKEMQLRLGNLPLRASKPFYNNYYRDANISVTNFYFNHLSVLRLRFERQHAGLFERNKLGFGFLDPDTFYVNDDNEQLRSAPYFVHERNLLIVPMLFLQLPFFHHSSHALFHYSLVGFIMGHEMNHGFDANGVMMDAFGDDSHIGYGISRRSDFRTSLECFQRFSRTNSINERTADINGFQLAFDAFFDLENSNLGKELSSFTDISPLQLYFLNFGQFFCGELPIPIDHDRDDVRVNEIVANMPEFLNAFKCLDAKYKLNREDKQCEMWRTNRK